LGTGRPCPSGTTARQRLACSETLCLPSTHTASTSMSPWRHGGGVCWWPRWQLPTPYLHVAVGELKLLTAAITSLELWDQPDDRSLPGFFRGAPRATDFYNCIRAPASPPPLMPKLNSDSPRPKKVQIFFWILYLDHDDHVRTRDSVHRHGALDSSDCPFCLDVPECATHLFVACPRLAELWAALLPAHTLSLTPLDCAAPVAESFGSSPSTTGTLQPPLCSGRCGNPETR
jgi:hypothetical protein